MYIDIYTCLTHKFEDEYWFDHPDTHISLGGIIYIYIYIQPLSSYQSSISGQVHRKGLLTEA